MKFKVGDNVTVVEYGHIIHGSVKFMSKTGFKLLAKSEDGKNGIYDMSADIVGKSGVVDGINGAQYSVDGIMGKHAWYDEIQLVATENQKER